MELAPPYFPWACELGGGSAKSKPAALALNLLCAQRCGWYIQAWYDEGVLMPMGRDFRAISRGPQGRPGAAPVFCGLLLLMVP
jgi:hypothetical protein